MEISRLGIIRLRASWRPNHSVDFHVDFARGALAVILLTVQAWVTRVANRSEPLFFAFSKNHLESRKNAYNAADCGVCWCVEASDQVFCNMQIVFMKFGRLRRT